MRRPGNRCFFALIGSSNLALLLFSEKVNLVSLWQVRRTSYFIHRITCIKDSEMKMNLASCLDQSFWVMLLFAENDCDECRPGLDTHEVVEDGVEGGREIVEEAREVHEILIDSPVDIAVGEVDISKPLDVKRSPRDEE